MPVMESVREVFSEPVSAFDFTMNMVISVMIGLLTILLVFYYTYYTRRGKLPTLPSPLLMTPKPRFRKRDKVMFYGRRILRKCRTCVRTFTKTMRPDPSGSGRGRSKKKQLLKLARKILRLKKDLPTPLKAREPPQSFLEADLPEMEYEHWLPPEVMYMLKSVRVFGHFEKPLFLELCKHMETQFIQAGRHLFRVGDIDKSIYVIQSGKLNVYIKEVDGCEYCVKEVGQGDHIHSLLSVIDVLTGHPANYKTVSAIATEDSTVLRLPVEAFHSVLERFPETLVRVMQIIMVRLQRVTFMAMHNYLGLSNELINPESQSQRGFSVHSLQTQASPSRLSRATVASLDSERVQNVIDYDENTAEEQELKKNTASAASETPAITIPGSHHLRNRGSSEDLENSASDFQAACTRARVTNLPTGDPILVGSPPIKASMEDSASSSSQSTPSRKSRKVNITDPVHSSVSTLPTADIWELDEEYVLQLAAKDISVLFGLEDEGLLKDRLTLRQIRQGTTLIKQGDQDASLMFVVTGNLQVLQQVVGKESEERSLFLCHPGELVGTLAVLTGEQSFFTIRARSDSCVVVITKSDFYSIMAKQPTVVLNVGHEIVKRMSPFVRQIDFALDWMHLEAGKALFRQGEQSECIYIVLNGRLRSVVTLIDGKKELVGEYGRGELVGLVEVLTQTERATTIMAVRDTELAVIPEGLLNMIKRKYPQIVTRLVHLLGQRILGTLKNRNVAVLSEHPNVDPRPSVANLATVAILPVSEDVPLYNFTLELQFSLNNIGPTLRLNSDIIEKRLGAAALDNMNEYRLLSWLGQQEDIHRMVLYQCDNRMSAWTQRCIRQADCILIVALADKEPTVGQIEKQLEHIAVRAQKELILLHTEDAQRPTNTVEWLNARGWCTSHHHIRGLKRVFSKRPKHKVTEYYRQLFETSEPDKLSDFSRLARVLTGTAIGLVLGGGGARGSAHVGMIRAMREAGIPIDMVGGVSIGSFMGALYCEEANITRFIQRAREWSMDMARLGPKLMDLTYPMSAMFSGRQFNGSIEKVFGNHQVEDLWIPYFCLTTDITASKMRVHTSGSLWRYVRASMSLSGYIPPLCDPVDGHLLLDGGYVNNLPADVMKTMGAQNIFAIDVGSQDDSNLTNYGDELSGWWLLWKRWNPWAKPVRVPNMAEIQSRLAYVSCVRQLEMVKNSDYCEYIRPPIDKYNTLQFASYDEIQEVGYSHGKALFSTWTKRNLVAELFREKSTSKMKPILHKTAVPVEPDFTDLAELICRIDEPRRVVSHTFSHQDDDDDDEYEDVEDEPVDLIATVSSSSHLHKRKMPKQKSLSELGSRSDSKVSLRNRKRSSSTDLGRMISQSSNISS